jgi:hypothetical protein
LLIALLFADSGAVPVSAPPAASTTNRTAESEAVRDTRFVHGSPPNGVPGPWALSGWRIGANALKRLGITREQAWEIEVVHRTVFEVRYTCMADGLMASTGVSPGKMNLSLEKVANEDQLETVITHKKSGRRLIYRLTQAFRDRIRDIDYADFPKAAKTLEGLKDEEIFTVVEEKLP